MCGRRGLEVESDLQTYEVAFTTAFRIQFDRILGPLRAEKAEGTSPPSAASLGPRSKSQGVRAGGGASYPLDIKSFFGSSHSIPGEGQGLSETVIKAYEAMNNLLTTFIERVRMFMYAVQYYTTLFPLIRASMGWTIPSKTNSSQREYSGWNSMTQRITPFSTEVRVQGTGYRVYFRQTFLFNPPPRPILLV